ncbi:MAG: nuclear transport factor 2 family protein [Acidimicrobiales bacterium]
MDRTGVVAWIASYEDAWRSAGTERLADLFTEDSTYLASPWRPPLRGLSAIARFWDAERDGPGEVFAMDSEIVAVDGDVAVVRVEVKYGRGTSRWRDLWVVRFAPDGRCVAFEEWPFAPNQPDGH